MRFAIHLLTLFLFTIPLAAGDITDKIPQDLWGQILHHLDAQSLTDFSLVNTKWQHTAEIAAELLYKNTTRQLDKIAQEKSFLHNYILTHFPKMKYVKSTDEESDIENMFKSYHPRVFYCAYQNSGIVKRVLEMGSAYPDTLLVLTASVLGALNPIPNNLMITTPLARGTLIPTYNANRVHLAVANHCMDLARLALSLRKARPDLVPKQVRELLVQTANKTPLLPQGGICNKEKALEAIKKWPQ